MLRGHRKEVTSAAFTDDGRTIVTGSDDGKVISWDAGSGEPESVMPAPSGRLTAVAVDPTGVQVMIAGGNNREGAAVVRDLRSGEPLERLAVPGGVPPFSGAYSGDGRRLAIGGSDGT